ncbi:helix-turn-helix domain-containing protein [Zophobihabitans entericus]|uniref:Helix-turn-helix domain-containing protein n=2 Tax=Zophobihabitans entericus TaxID=1635327 RepID=A0A6G9IED7_9GAMM|nr:helix-turn-helix domain-containing protein [Zophobihabitans entericus]
MMIANSKSNSPDSTSLPNINEETNTFAQRLRFVIGKQSMTTFAEMCQLSESAIRKYVRGDSEPTLQNLLIIAKVGNVSVSWLATGEDPADTNTNSYTLNDNISGNFTAASSTNNYLINEVDFNSLLDKENPPKTLGQWSLSKNWLRKEKLLNENLFMTTISGDSSNGLLTHGDIALINIKPWFGALEGIFVVALNNTLLIKRIQYDPIENGYHI